MGNCSDTACILVVFLNSWMVDSRMKVLKEMHKELPMNRRDRVVKWLKQQMVQNNFSCTTEMNSDAGSSKSLALGLKENPIQGYGGIRLIILYFICIVYDCLTETFTLPSIFIFLYLKILYLKI